MLAAVCFDVLLEDPLVLGTEDSVCGDNEDDKTSDTAFNLMELRTTVGAALAELLSTEGVVGTGMTLPLFKQLKSILTGLSSKTFSPGQSLDNTASFS